MPELPEVEIVRRRLAPRVVGRRIETIDVADPTVSSRSDEELRTRLVGRHVLGTARRGKWLILELSRSTSGPVDMLAIIHLRMTGRLLFDRRDREEGRAPRYEIGFDDGSRLHFYDARRFGRLDAVPAAEASAFFARLGVEPLDDAFTVDRLRELLAGRRAPLKSFLLDQRHLAGVGNIYADEALFRARLHPLRPAGSVGPREAQRLYVAVRETLRLGIEHEGSSVESFVDPAGDRGGFQEILNVYQRTGQPCRACGTAIRRVVAGGRSTHFCPSCQPRRSMRVRTSDQHPTVGRRPTACAPPGERDEPTGVARLYVVATRVPRRERRRIGALGESDLSRGWYAYVGSARRGRDARIRRHRRAEKPLRWHADYLFAAHPATMAWTVDLPEAESGDRPGAGSWQECRLAESLAAAGRLVAPRFGASDCGCPGHLIRFDSRSELVAAVAEAASRLGVDAMVR